MNNRLLQDINGNTSSKRVMAYIMLILSMCMIFGSLIYSMFFVYDIPKEISTLINILIITGGGLLVGGVFEKGDSNENKIQQKKLSDNL